MKSLMVARDYFPPQVGGISTMMAAITRTLGPEAVCCLTDVLAEGAGEPFDGARVYRRPGVFRRQSAGDFAQLAGTLLQLLLVERPRVAQLACCNDASVGLLLDRVFGLPFVVYAHGNEVLEALQGSWERNLDTLRGARRVIANSTYTAGLVAECGVARERIVTINPGCDVERHAPRQISPERRMALLRGRGGPAILTVANLVQRKGHESVIRLLPHLLRRFPELTYVIVGKGPYEAELRRLAEEIGVSHAIIFAGKISDQDISDYYAACDVFALLSTARLEHCDVEGFGMVFLEANACGKAVIGTRTGGIPDAIQQGRTGLLVDSGDPAGALQAFETILGDPELARRFGEEGRIRAVREFSWDVVGARIALVLRDAVGERRSHPHPLGSARHSLR